jgi:hypothetical protein
MTEPDLMNAKTLLHKYLDLLGHSPDVSEWTEESLGDNEPRLHRLKRLQALFAAFGLPWDIPAFREGAFIDASDRYLPVLERARAEFPNGRDYLEPQVSVHMFRFFFRTLLDYREKADRALEHHSGVLEAFGLFVYACQKVSEANDQLRQAVEPIEDLLAACISPTWQTFPRDQLVRDFGYSDVDLGAIDADWA